MIPPKIQEALETHPELNDQLLMHGFGTDWKKFNRTHFEFIARRINNKVTSIAVRSPSLILDKLIIGKDQVESYVFKKKLANEDALIQYLAQHKRPINWISGKTLFSYWNKGRAKDTKLNVLLVYLGIDHSVWDDWKSIKGSTHFTKASSRIARKYSQQDLIRNYYLGSYNLYYQKSDGSANLVKAPFIIGLDDRGLIYAETLTEGHPYRSTLIEIREGILYIHCENQVFDEKENHIFNVGNETNPEVLFGVSNTISVKMKMAIGIRNVLIRQKNPFTSKTFVEKEISFIANAKKFENEETVVLRHFLQQTANLINSQSCCPYADFKEAFGK